MDYKKIIAEKLNIEGVSIEELTSFIETPPNNEMGDFALPCFKLSKIMKRPPVLIAQDLQQSFASDEFISQATAINGYLNFKINRQNYALNLLNEIESLGENYGSDTIGQGKTVCIDYSSINIA